MQKGFSTLFIVIILGSVALALAIALATSSLWAVRSGIDTKNSAIAKALVNACSEVALEIMRGNNSYTGTANVTLNGNTCTYIVANTGGTTRSVAVSGVVKDITRKLNISTSSFNSIVVSFWQEVP